MNIKMKRLASVVGVAFFATAVLSATPILNIGTPLSPLTPQPALTTSPVTFTLTNSAPAPPGYIQLASGGISSLPLNWNFFALPGWADVVEVTSVEFDLTLGLNNPANPSKFTLYLQDTLSNLIGPQTLVNSGTAGPQNTFTFNFLTSDPTIVSAFLSDGFASTLLARDPGGNNTNSFLYVRSAIIVNAQATPEPASYLMIGTGLTAAALFFRRRRKA